MKKLTTEEFIEKAREVHGDKYDYSLVDYKNNDTKVKIICPKHGEFEQMPSNHLRYGCRKCSRDDLKSTSIDFIKKAKEVHGNKYDYSKVAYKESRVKVKIICPKHGEFEQTPYSHLKGRGCPRCATENRKPGYTTEEFIEKAREVHGDKYDYSQTVYKGDKIKVKIICPVHGEFWKTPRDHIRSKSGCPECTGNKKLTTEEFIEKAREVHGDKYDYSLVDYKNNDTKVKIICPIHGVFEQLPGNHLKSTGCLKCSREVSSKKKRNTTEEFIEKAREVHGDKYDYSLVDYIDSSTKVKIICPIHGVFEQLPSNHLSGGNCPKCKSSKLEDLVRSILISYGVIFEEQKTWDWLVYKSYQFVDFFLPEYNLVIECQGIQHFEYVGLFGGEGRFENTLERDRNKRSLCKSHNLNIVYVSNLGENYNYPYEVITDIENFIKDLIKTNLTN